MSTVEPVQTRFEVDARVLQVGYYQRAFTVAFGVTLSPFLMRELIDKGLPQSLLPALGALAQDAAPRIGGPVEPVDQRRRTAQMLTQAAARWTANGLLDPEQVVGWAAVIAGVANQKRALIAMQDIGQALDVCDDRGNSVWAQVPDGLGPLGWAAGIEAHAVPNVPVPDLQAMAALRGYALPAPGTRP